MPTPSGRNERVYRARPETHPLGPPGASGPGRSGGAPTLAGVILDDLEAVLVERRRSAPPESYSATLLADPEKAQRKIMEEAFEVCLELGRGEVDAERAAEEAADLVFHLLAGLVGAGVPLRAVYDALEARRR